MEENAREIIQGMIIIRFCLSLDTKKVSLKDNHRGVIDKILAIQDRH